MAHHVVVKLRRRTGCRRFVEGQRSRCCGLLTPKVRAMLVTRAMGTCSMRPAEDFATVPLHGSAAFGNYDAVGPAASAGEAKCAEIVRVFNAIEHD